MVRKYRLMQERGVLVTKAIIDSQSVKNTDCASKRNKGYDGGKKVGGIKRHILTDTDGLPLEIMVTPANISERDVCFQILLNQGELVQSIEEVFADSGYKGERFEFDVYYETGVMITIVPRKKNKKHEFSIVPKRWVVERSFSWLDKCHRLWKNTERYISTSKTMIQLCFIRLLARRLAKGRV
jgi:transposase